MNFDLKNLFVLVNLPIEEPLQNKIIITVKDKFEELIKLLKRNYVRNVYDVMENPIKNGVVCAECLVSIRDIKDRIRNCTLCKSVCCLVCD